ncbi:glycosyltransferase family 2 protein [Flavihumibacter profundi]|uniref:glycosyltransferase family 2 protein n=1 Tax=Flavihumibacter profundi TaxID=2716883 RepID=UPI001CC6AD50|nr:glycosyltransferase family 2 protein [Flavihumibacter profundi]MBZ5857453.1 glycosyltransferase family 2 protein [Flavihumibacter profundi]
MSQLYIIIPAYNEQGMLNEVIKNIRQVTAAHIIVVDDGSRDPLYVDQDFKSVNLLRHYVNLGQGAALATGIQYALQLGADMVVTFDADGQHDPKDIAAITEPVKSDQADIVFGSRFMGTKNQVPVLKRILIAMARTFHWLLTGYRMTDAHNGLRAMNRKAATVIRITENRMAHATEILFEIKRHKLRWKEVPVNIVYTPYSQKKGQSPANSIRIFFDVVLHKLFR